MTQETKNEICTECGQQLITAHGPAKCIACHIARAHVGKGEVETHITDMEIAHDMSHTAFCDEGHWRDEFIAAKEKAIAGLSSKPVEADKELARLKRLVEVLSNLKFAIIQAMFTLNSIGDATDLERVKKAANHEYLKLESALEALAAADRIAKGEV